MVFLGEGGQFIMHDAPCNSAYVGSGPATCCGSNMARSSLQGQTDAHPFSRKGLSWIFGGERMLPQLPPPQPLAPQKNLQSREPFTAGGVLAVPPPGRPTILKLLGMRNNPVPVKFGTNTNPATPHW